MKVRTRMMLRMGMLAEYLSACERVQGGWVVEQVVAYRRQENTVFRSTPYRAATKNSGPWRLSQFGRGTR